MRIQLNSQPKVVFWLLCELAEDGEESVSHVKLELCCSSLTKPCLQDQLLINILQQEQIVMDGDKGEIRGGLSG